MKKALKCLLVALMLFSQLASPTLVIADVLDPVDIGSSINYVFDFEPTVTDSNISINIKDSATESLIEDTNKYIIKTKITFEQVQNDIVINSSNEEKILLLTGLELKDYDLSFTNLGNGINGNYNFEFNLYETDDTLVDTSESGLIAYITNKEVTYTNTVNEIYKNIIPTTLNLKAESDDLVCIDKTCTLDMNATDKLVDLSYKIDENDKTIDNLDIAYYKYTINDKLTLYNYNFDETLDFSLMLYGTYKISLSLMNKNGQAILTDNIDIVYSEVNNNQNLDDYYIVDENTSQEELLSKLISTTVLDEDTINNLGLDIDLLEDIVTKKPIDNKISEALTNTVGSDVIADSFATVDEETYFGIIKSDSFIGKLKDSDTLLTVEQIESALANTGLEITVVDKDGNTVTSDRFIETGMKLKVKMLSQELSYTFIVTGDLDGGLISNSEVNTIIDALLEIQMLDNISIEAADINKDGTVDILDVSKLAGSIAIQNWINANPYGDNITSTLNNTTSVIRVGDTFKVTFNLKGFSSDYINAIEGILNYDKNSLSLVGISVGDALSQYGNFNYSTSHFIQAGLDIVDKDSTIMTFTFKALKETNTTISINEIEAAMDGEKITIDNNTTLNIKIDRQLSNNNDIIDLKPSTGTLDKEFNKDVLEYNIYVDYNTTSITLQGLLGDKYASTMGFREYKLTGDNTVIYLDVTSETGEVKTYKINVIKVYPKSSNNYLAKLEIAGYEIEFNKDVLEYEITVDSDVDSLDITAIAEVLSSNVRIYGNDSFEEGENIVKIVVTAEDGSEKTYTIKVNKKAKENATSKKVDSSDDEDDDTTNNNTEKTIIIILIILVVAGLLYLIFKKDDEEGNKPKVDTSKK